MNEYFVVLFIEFHGNTSANMVSMSESYGLNGCTVSEFIPRHSPLRKSPVTHYRVIFDLNVYAMPGPTRCDK